MSNLLSIHNSSFSPDIFGLQIAWDSTSLGTLKECPRKYQLSLMQGWSPRETSVHLYFGQLYHKALEIYDHARSAEKNHEEALCAATLYCLEATWVRSADGKGKPWISDSPYKNRLTLVRSVIWYLCQFQEDSCTTIQLSSGRPAVELSFRIPLSDFLTPTGQEYILCGHIDRLVLFEDQPYVLDRKTTKTTLSSEFFIKYNPDNQFQIYNLAGQLVWQIPTRGVIVDAAQIAVGFTRFQRGIVKYAHSQNEEFYKELGVWFKTAATYAEAAFWPKNEKSCSNYGGCPFRPICSKPVSIREEWLEAAFHQRTWDPLVVRGDI